MVLWRVVAVRDEADAEVLARLQLARLVDVAANLLDVLRRGRDVAALAARAVLHEDEVTADGVSRGLPHPIWVTHALASEQGVEELVLTASSAHRPASEEVPGAQAVVRMRAAILAGARMRVRRQTCPCLHP